MNEHESEAAARHLEGRENQPTPVQPPAPPPTPTPQHSLGKARSARDGDEEPAIPEGYIELYSDGFPSGGIFYPEGARFFVKPATVGAVRQFSTVNEQDPFAVAEGFNDILKTSLHVRGIGKMFSYKDILDEDRIHIIMAIREATFVKGENRLVVDAKCPACKEKTTIELRNEAFERTVVDPKVMRYYDPKSRQFAFQTKTFGEVRVSPPTIGVMSTVTEYIKEQQREGREIDLSFVKVLPFIAGDWRSFDLKAAQRLEVQVMGWNMDKFQFMNTLVEKIRVGVKETLHGTCSTCDAKVATPVTFPGGVKALFVVSDLDSELS